MTNATIDLLMSHRSIRKFTDQPIDDDTLTELVKAGQAASSSSFIQAYTLIDIVDKEKRAALAQCANNQKYVLEAARFLVCCADLKRLADCSERYGEQANLGYAEQLIMGSVDVALVAQNIVIAAESIGLGAVYIGAIRNNPADVTRILNLPQQVYPVFGLCLGYPDQDPGLKPRLPTEVILHRDEYQSERFDEYYADYDQLTTEYYTERTAGQITTGWPEHMSVKITKETRPHMLEYLQSQGFAKR